MLLNQHITFNCTEHDYWSDLQAPFELICLTFHSTNVKLSKQVIYLYLLFCACACGVMVKVRGRGKKRVGPDTKPQDILSKAF